MSRIWRRQNSAAVTGLLFLLNVQRTERTSSVKMLVHTIMYVDWELVELNTNPMCSAWILIFTEGGALMRTRQVWLVLDVVGFSKTPLGENSWMSQSVGRRHSILGLIKYHQTQTSAIARHWVLYLLLKLVNINISDAVTSKVKEEVKRTD